jgi:hypothetical protein
MMRPLPSSRYYRALMGGVPVPALRLRHWRPLGRARSTFLRSGRPSNRWPHDAASKFVGGRAADLSARAVVAVLAVALAAGCSSDDDAADSTAATTSFVTAAPSSTAPTIQVTTVPSTATPTTLTATPTTLTATPTTLTISAPPPTPAPTTSVNTSGPVGPESEVRAAIAAATEAFSACLLALPACDPATLEATRSGAILAVNQQNIEDWNAAGYAVRDRDQFRYVIESVEVDASGTSATAVVCIADGSKLVMPGAGPGGADVIVDGTYVSGRESWEMQLEADGVWRVHDAPALGPTESSDVCPPR